MARPGILYCHLNDDCSGSPRVLAHSIEALAAHFADAAAFIASGPPGGFLEQSGVCLRRYSFRKSLKHPWLGLSFLFGQVQLLLKMALSRPLPDAPVYVNTFLPVGGALFGALTRRPVVFHSHEIPHSRLEKILFAITVRCSSLVICVSETHAGKLAVPPSRGRRVVVVPNALDPEFARVAAMPREPRRRGGKFRVLYATAALSPQKGLPEFLQLAEAIRGRNDIALVLATTRHEAERVPAAMPPNVSVHWGEPSLASIYGAVDVVLNLSRPDLSVETFGLTILEAMAFGTPAIVPRVGGPASLVRDGVEGFHVDCRETGSLVEVLTRLADDEALWLRLSAAARRRAGDFSFAAYERALARALLPVLPSGRDGAPAGTAS